MLMHLLLSPRQLRQRILAFEPEQRRNGREGNDRGTILLVMGCTVLFMTLVTSISVVLMLMLGLEERTKLRPARNKSILRACDVTRAMEL